MYMTTTYSFESNLLCMMYCLRVGGLKIEKYQKKPAVLTGKEENL